MGSAKVMESKRSTPVVGKMPANGSVGQWLDECIVLCQPDCVRILDGSPEEKQILLDLAVAEGVLHRLNQDLLPGCYLHRSHHNDVARTEH